MGKLRSLPQRLDSFNKILIATSQINYMASSLNGVNAQIKLSGLIHNPIYSEGVKETDEMLAIVVQDLRKVMNKLGNIINKNDCICPIDMRVGKVPFEIIESGMDECQNDYED